MEKSEYNNQAIQEHQGDYVGKRRQHNTTMMSADERSTRQACSSCQSLREPESNVSAPQKSTFPANRARRANTQFTWRRSSSSGMLGYILVLIASLWIMPTSAVFIDFQNCLSDAVQNDTPRQLQFDPLFVYAVFNTTGPSNSLYVTVWGNVTGSDITNALPSANDTDYWGSPNTTDGKIVHEVDDGAQKLTTLFNKVNVLTYLPWNGTYDFCEQLVNGSCPLAPSFYANATNPYEYPSFNLSHNFDSSYAFSSFTPTLLVKNGDKAATVIACISANVTPDLGSTYSNLLKFLPLVVLLFVGFATTFAAVFSPWGTTDTFRWTTNYGRDEDLLRLVTPGFGDCLQYIQFIALTGALTLNYPGFYRPVTSKVAWSSLMFNESFVSHGDGSQSLVDGIYVTHGTYGLDRMRQLIGMTEVDDIWAGMAVWLLVILAASLVLIQFGLLSRWVYRHIKDTSEEDLRAKNMPFSMGMVIRVVFSYFLLPIVALSTFQLVVAGRSPTYGTALAAVMLILIVGFAIWLLYLIASTRPRSFLFDDLPTVLLYGSLYNTYSDDAAPFALVPVTLTFVRGIAIGGVQASGIAQLVMLAICEVIFVLTLHAFRPFHSPTSMNAYHTFFAIVRFAIILLMIAFAPSLGVTDGPKGWIGYAILLMHGIVLVFGFLLNALQTIIEVGARLAGAGGDESGAARGGLTKVFGMRQLSRRLPRRDAGSRQSQLSHAAMLDGENDRKSYMVGDGRLRSQSAGSNAVLLNRQSTGLESIGTDPFGAIPPHQLGSAGSSHTPTTPGEASTFSFLPSAAAPAGHGRNRGPALGIQTQDTADPYYRPPRARYPTLEGASSPAARSRGSWASADWANKRWSQQDLGAEQPAEEGPSISGRGTPVQQPPGPSDGSPNEPRRSKADYTTREVDFYYGVRGPALNANIPNRRIKTGPADPTGIPASAAGWFKNMFGGKTKEKGKGFEVVRSSRMPPGMARPRPGEVSPPTPPEGIPVATGGIRNGPIDSDDDEPSRARPAAAGLTNAAAAAASPEDQNLVSPLGTDDDASEDEGDFHENRVSALPPVLPGIEIGESGIELPSRFPSKATSRASSRRAARMTDTSLMPDIPGRVPSGPRVPSKSSRRQSQSIDMSNSTSGFLHQTQSSVDPSRLPFTNRSTSSNRQSTISTKSSLPPPEGDSADVSNDRPTSIGHANQHSIRIIDQSDHPEFLGTSAEVVDGRPSGASSMEHTRIDHT